MIENVVVYVADSLRWDFLPPSVADRGIAFETVAQSSFSAPSFATLATGLYPSQHGVFDWHNRTPDEVESLFELDGFDSGFWQDGDVAGHEIYPILRQNGKTALSELEEPFFYLERNDDPHVPFGGTAATSAEEYYTTRKGDWDRMRAEYRQGAKLSAERFEDRLAELRERGVLDRTLVVFTSDHGELLGEGGEVGHTSPLRPELTYVPTVFVHEGLSAEDFHADPGSDVVEHVDVVTTILGALGRSGTLPTAGVDLLTESRPREWGFNQVDIRRNGRSMYAAEGIWWPDGGFLVHRNRAINRLAKATYGFTKSASRHSVRHRPISLLWGYLRSSATFGTLPTTEAQARELIDAFRSDLSAVETRTVELNADVEATLEDMGYL
jgi:arylsulfatase A-like enzyme